MDIASDHFIFQAYGNGPPLVSSSRRRGGQRVHLDWSVSCQRVSAIALSAPNALLDIWLVSVHTVTGRTWCRWWRDSRKNGPCTVRAADRPVLVDGAGASWRCTPSPLRLTIAAMVRPRRSCR